MREMAFTLYTGGKWPGPDGFGVRILREPRHGPPPDDASAELLANAVRGHSDEEIAATLTTWGGADGVLRLVFDGMADRIDPRAACVVGFDVGAGYALRIVPGKAAVELRIPGDTDAIVRMTTPDFLRMVVREMAPPQLVADGRMTIDGDVSAAQRLFEMLPAGRTADAS
jgi:hypothetical protein